MKYIYLLSLVLFFISCEKDAELSASIKIPDPDNPQLPVYSEWGYNTFGAQYERDVFVYSNYEIPLKIIVQDSHITFFFQGTKGNSAYMSLKITMPENSIEKYQDLLSYSDTLINLNNPGILVEMTTNGTTSELNLISGYINFIRAQQLYVDKIEGGIILSGKFSLKFLSDGIPYSMSEGRFDLGIDDNIFYVL